MPETKINRAKRIQRRAQGIVDHAEELREIEEQAKMIAARTKEIEDEVLSRNLNGATPHNNRSDFTNKEVYLLLLDEMNSKLSKHIEFCDSMTARYIPEFNKQVETLASVIKDMPNKGFCENVDRMYHDFYPEKDESIPDKVKTLWYDRKILKWIVGLCVGTLITGLITVAIGFMKGVF